MSDNNRVVFYACPDCGSDEYPTFDRDDFKTMSGYEPRSLVSSRCVVCGWSTNRRKTVRSCAADWNGEDMS